MLVEHFVKRYSRDLKREVREVAPDAMERLLAYQWPGNVRELQSVLKQALLRASGPVLLSSFLPESLEGPNEAVEALSPTSESNDDQGLDAFIRTRLRPDTRICTSKRTTK